MEYVLFELEIAEQEVGDLRSAMHEMLMSMQQDMWSEYGDHTLMFIGEARELLKMVGL